MYLRDKEMETKCDALPDVEVLGADLNIHSMKWIPRDPTKYDANIKYSIVRSTKNEAMGYPLENE